MNKSKVATSSKSLGTLFSISIVLNDKVVIWRYPTYCKFQTYNHTIMFSRLPIVDEKAPKEENFDDMLNVLREQGPDTACVFNCQMGKGRTTTGMILSCLMKGYNLLV